MRSVGHATPEWASADDIPGRRRALSNFAVFAAVARRGGPRLIEAMVVPAVLFYLCLLFVSVLAAYLTALGWAFGAMAVRRVAGRPISSIQLMVAVGLTGRTALALATGSTFVYFAQPVAGAVVLAALFVASIAVGRPIIGHIAHDFCPLDADAAGRAGVTRLFRRLTYLWAGVILLKAGTTLALMLTLSLSTFVLTKTLALWGVTAAAIVVTFALSFRTTRLEQLVPVSLTGAAQRFVVTAAHNAAPAD